MTDEQSLDEVQFCSFCSEPFPMDDPMVDYDGQTFCSPRRPNYGCPPSCGGWPSQWTLS